MTIRVVIADDEAIVRHGLRLILDSQDDLEVVGEAADGVEAVRLVRQGDVDVVLMDLRMPHLGGIEATRLVADHARVLVLTTYDLDDNLYRAVQAGACGFLLKTSPPEDLVHAVRVVARGDALLEPIMLTRLLQEFVRQPPPGTAVPEPFLTLSDRELDVLRLVAVGLTNAEIAARLHVSAGTVKTHVASILAKLGVRDRIQAVVACYESGFVRPGLQ
ncbi:DNA-binding response regulator [Nocardioides immobilis]|uniref:DNA-binding response regulator n=1 Tax=Nocardioides immobilis TaxID=2049295 RepID=A0A417Y6N8_9ACTN|nr:response regulator transcription factor [Nocardioides immobilis]RHW28319.1 DNA-binding response regulator [Nocardioides immobilis]